MFIISTHLDTLKTSGIYKISVQDSELFYIGSSNSLIRRAKEHGRLLKKGKHFNKNLQHFYDEGSTLNFEMIKEVEQKYLWESELKEIEISGDYLLNLSNFTKNSKTTFSFDEETVKRIAELYNSGLSGCRISEIIYGSRTRRSSINSLIKGETYSHYRHLFNFREYTQKGRKLPTLSTCKKYKGLSKEDRQKLIKKDIQYIIDNYKNKTIRELAKDVSISSNTVASFLKEEGLFDKECIKNISKNKSKNIFGTTIGRFTVDGEYVDERPCIKDYEKMSFYYEYIMKSIRTGEPYKNFIFKKL